MTKKSSYAWLVLLGLVLIQFCSVGIIFNTSANYMAPILQAHPDFTAAGYGVTSTIQSICGLIILLTVGKIVAKIGVRNMMIIGTVACVAMQLILSVANSLPVFYAAYAIFGFGSNLIAVVSAPVLINAWFGKHHGILFGVSAAAMGLGGIVFSPLIGNWISTVGYQTSYLYCAIIIAVLCTIGCILIKNRPDPGVLPLWAEPVSENAVNTVGTEGVELAGMTLKEALKGPKFYMLFIGSLLLQACFMCVLLSYGNFAAMAGMSAVGIGVIFMIYNFFNTFLQISAGWLADKVGPKVVMFSGALLFVGLSLIAMSIQSLGSTWVYIAGGMLGYCVTTLMVPMQVLVRKLYGLKDFAGILGIASIPISIGAAFLPIFNAAYDATQSYNSAFIGAIVAAVIGVVLLMAIRTKSASIEVPKADL